MIYFSDLREADSTHEKIKCIVSRLCRTSENEIQLYPTHEPNVLIVNICHPMHDVLQSNQSLSI